MAALIYTVLAVALLGLCQSATLVSLDLGTEFMKIGIVKPGVPIDIVLNTETKRKTPMVVYIKDEERLFGDAAVSRGMKSPKNAYSNLLDLLGKDINNPIVQDYKLRFPYHEIEAHPVTGTVVFRHGENTFYSVEELMAMQVEHAIALATSHGGSAISKVIIVTPPFFNQREREALMSVAEISQVQVLQLMSQPSSIALQYAVFRNIEMVEKPLIVLFATVGAQFTSAAVVSYALQKDKMSGDKKATVQIMGVGYDRNLGGFEMDMRLRDYLAAKFTEKYPKKSPITKNKRAMSKLLKEAKKVKTVLSANQETRAQVETLHEDTDFRLKVTREELENLFADLYPRIAAPFKDAITTSGVSEKEIDQVVLFGGGTRVPRIQEEIKKATGASVLHKYINTDEAAAMGSAFMAATASSVFRTKEIKLKDANQFPFFVAFHKLILNEGGDISEEKLVNKELYYRNNAYPQKKAMTFTKFTDDFHFNVSYGNLGLEDRQTKEFGVEELMRVNIKGVRDVFNQHHDKTSKGIKAHLLVGESGMITVDSVEAIFETIPANKTEAGWLDSVSNFFGGNEEGEKKEGEGEAKKEEGSEKKEEGKEEKKEDNTTDTKNTTKTDPKKDDKKVEPKSDKPVIVRENLKIETIYYGIPKLGDSTLSREKLAALQKIDDEKRATEESRNKLESFVISMKDRLTSDIYVSASTAEEMEKIQGALEAESNWIEEESWGETYKVFNERLAKLEDYTDPVINRVKEMKGREAAVADLKQAFNLTEQFLAKIANQTEELRYHTAIELEQLEKLMNDSKDYLKETSAAQDKLAQNQDPVLKLTDLVTKKTALERDLYYLVRKPIPQWYKEKLKKMMDELKNNGTKTAGEGEKVTNDDTVVEGEETKEGDKKEERKEETKEEKKDEAKEEKKEEPKKEGEDVKSETPVKTEGDDETKKVEL